MCTEENCHKRKGQRTVPTQKAENSHEDDRSIVLTKQIYRNSQLVQANVLNAITRHNNANLSYIMPSRVAETKMTDTTTCLLRCRANRNLIHCCLQCQMLQLLLRAIWHF